MEPNENELEENPPESDLTLESLTMQALADLLDKEKVKESESLPPDPNGQSQEIPNWFLSASVDI